MSRRISNSSQLQRGAALMVMLVVVVLGTITLLVSQMNSAQVTLDRNRTTADALAKAKEALIGRATIDITLPGSLPCPDNNNDGSADLLSGNDCPNYIGRLPWKTLGLPDLRDGSGERLWYALARNFRDDNSAHPLNSDSQGNLSLSGLAPVNNVIAIVFAPGNVISGQSRSDTLTAICASLKNTPTVAHSLCASNYLESGNANLSTAAAPNTAYQQNVLSDTFNDQMITITHDQLFTPVEMRIAREAKNCLDDYATNNANKYPWAADTTDTSFYYSKSNTLFGRLPKHQTPDNDVRDMLNALNALQVAVTNCASGTGNQATLVATGANLDNTASNVKDNQPTSPAIPTSVTNPLRTAGDRAKDANVTCSDINANPSGNSIQTNLNTALSALNGLPSSLGWTASCALITSGYWPDWRDQVFYQVAQDFAPTGAASCGGSCLSVTGSGNPAAGSGNYRAALVVARQKINLQTRAITTTDSQFLEGDSLGDNRHAATPSRNFVAYSPSDSNKFSQVNDLVLCLDGKVNCK